MPGNDKEAMSRKCLDIYVGKTGLNGLRVQMWKSSVYIQLWIQSTSTGPHSILVGSSTVALLITSTMYPQFQLQYLSYQYRKPHTSKALLMLWFCLDCFYLLSLPDELLLLQRPAQTNFLLGSDFPNTIPNSNKTDPPFFCSHSALCIFPLWHLSQTTVIVCKLPKGVSPSASSYTSFCMGRGRAELADHPYTDGFPLPTSLSKKEKTFIICLCKICPMTVHHLVGNMVILERAKSWESLVNTKLQG